MREARESLKETIRAKTIEAKGEQTCGTKSRPIFSKDQDKY
jgi:hypothetical protein